MARNVLLQCEPAAGGPVPMNVVPIEIQVASVIATLGLGFQQHPLNLPFNQVAMDGPPEFSQSAALFIAGSMDSVPDSGVVAGPGWTIRIFHNPQISTPTLVTGTAPAPVTHTVTDVKDALRLARFVDRGALGQDVAIGIVDGGINLKHLTDLLGTAPLLNAKLSCLYPKLAWKAAGKAGLGHGTMCAYDALIGAPRACLLELRCLRTMKSGAAALESLLDRTLYVYTQFEKKLPSVRKKFKAAVLSNSWEVSDPASDYAPGHPSAYVGNPSHPFNKIVGRLESKGVDIVFAAGNCRTSAGKKHCTRDGLTGAIYGANSHPKVLTVGAVDLSGTPLPDSSEGPGRLYGDKPDVACYSQFVGSMLNGPTFKDTFTSAACAVTSGILGAVRSLRPSSYTSSTARLTPAQVRTIIRDSAPGPFNNVTGSGVIDGARVESAI